MTHSLLVTHQFNNFAAKLVTINTVVVSILKLTIDISILGYKNQVISY